MIAEVTKVALEVLKIAPRYLFAFGACAAFLLFGSEELLKRLGVLDLALKNRAWLGLFLVFSLALFTVSVAFDLKGWYGAKRASAARSQSRLKRLHALTEDEKQILRFYFQENTRSNVLRIDDGVVKGLVSAGIIYQSASLGNILEGFAHNITDFAWEYLHENPQLLEGTTNTYRTDKRGRMW